MNRYTLEAGGMNTGTDYWTDYWMDALCQLCGNRLSAHKAVRGWIGNGWIGDGCPPVFRCCEHHWLAILPDVQFTPLPPTAEPVLRPLQCYCKYCGARRP